jgi:phospholipid/cholesterol/gamma-HCH transport system substrate-binding protein
MRSDGMKSSRSTEVKVGMGVILAAVILILGVVWIGDVRLSRKWETYSVYFDEVGGLAEGDPVAVSGLELGKVSAISLEGGRVKTEILIEEGVVLRKDCSIEIRSIGLMGEKYIYILPGKADEILPPGATVEGTYKADLPEVVAAMGDIMDDMKSAAQSLRRVVASMDQEYSLGESLAKLNEVSGEVLSLLKENRDDLRSTTRNMKSVSQDVREVVGGNKEEIEAGIAKFSRAAGRLDSLTITLRDLVDDVERGEGTLGLLVKEKRLHQEMENTIKALNDLIKDIKENPQRYVTVKLF